MDEKRIECKEIEALLPHRYPFLLVDRVLDWEKDKWIKAIKNVTANEPHFPGHFQGYPIMPGVLVIEALAQASGILMMKSLGVDRNEAGTVILAGVTKARFKRQVLPGDSLLLEAEFVRSRMNMAQMTCKASIDGNIACSAELLIAKEN